MSRDRYEDMRRRYEHALAALHVAYEDRAQRAEGELYDLRHPVKAAPAMPDVKTPPDILLRAIKRISPVPDRAYELNYQYAMSLEDRWSDDAAMRQAAHDILIGAGPMVEDEE